MSARLADAVRFGVVALLGLGLDLGLTALAVAVVGLPLALANTLGFWSAAALNYCLHESWTFRRTTPPRPRLSVLRAFGYAAITLATFGVRLGTILLLQSILIPLNSTAIILLAIGVSFVANFTLSSLLFSSKGSAS